jgi:DNA helicase-2/ATP-dependent DNA helicase PcrA
VVYCHNEHAETEEVAKRIRQHRQAGGEYSDVAVFYRVNALSRLMEQALRSRSIPYRIARGVEFYNRKEVRDVLAYLKLMVNPADDLACRRVINTPARGIGAATIRKLQAYGESSGTHLLEACRHGDEAGLGAAARKRAAAFAELMAAFSADVDRSVRAIMEDVVLRSGLEDALHKDDAEARQAAANVAELITAAAEFDAAEEGTLADYLHQVSLISDVDHFEGAGGAVTLMTLHAAKGLEFPTVFMIGCEDGLLPIRREGDAHRGWSGAGSDLEEERRLAFVGITRAKSELTMSCARNRMLRGRTTPQGASPFLSEIGEESIIVEDLCTPASETRRPRRRQAGGFYAERKGSEEIESAPAPPAEYQYLRSGSRVSHPLYGIGQVVKISLPWPQTRAEIHFEDCGPKRIVLRYAHLELLDEEA